MRKRKGYRGLPAFRLPPVPVYDGTGKVLGQVGATVTSVGASRVARCPVEFSGRFGTWGWVAKGTS